MLSFFVAALLFLHCFLFVYLLFFFVNSYIAFALFVCFLHLFEFYKYCNMSTCTFSVDLGGKGLSCTVLPNLIFTSTERVSGSGIRYL